MKRNKVPRTIRLRNRISKLESRLDNAWGSFDKPNPYRRCKGCNRAEPQISYDGHGWGCWVKGIVNEIKHYKELLNKENTKNDKVNELDYLYHLLQDDVIGGKELCKAGLYRSDLEEQIKKYEKAIKDGDPTITTKQH